jgi:hypothetical protein
MANHWIFLIISFYLTSASIAQEMHEDVNYDFIILYKSRESMGHAQKSIEAKYAYVKHLRNVTASLVQSNKNPNLECISIKKNKHVKDCYISKKLKLQFIQGMNQKACETGIEKNETLSLFEEIINQINSSRESKECSLLGEKHPNLNLSKFWAQEYIGSDLMVKFLKEKSFENRIRVDLFDSNTGAFIGEKDHANKVNSLIKKDNQNDSGVSFNIDSKSQIFDTKRSEDYFQHVDKILGMQKEERPLIINNSMGWEKGTNEAVSRLTQEGIIFVKASGNDNWYVEEESKINSDIIIVGSSTPGGFPSTFSNIGEEVSILAPSDSYIISRNLGQDVKFSGTSAAAPLVSGTIANALAIYPNIGIQNIKQVLKKTAIPVVSSFEKPQRNGPGIINSYKLVRVMDRLAQKCLSSEDINCIQNALNNPQTYNFESELSLEKLKQDAKDAFPTCNHKKQKKDISCNFKKEIFQKIKEASYLTMNSEWWDLLSCIQGNEGFRDSAIFYQHLSVASKELKEGGDFFSTPKKFYILNYFEKELNSNDDSRKRNALDKMIDYYKEDIGNAYNADGMLFLRFDLIKASVSKLKEKSFGLLRVGLMSGDDDVGKLCIDSYLLFGKKGISEVKKAKRYIPDHIYKYFEQKLVTLNL